ncbi:MAG: hypothetical protein ACRD40_19485 [Candidatus Acidiferrales bacterium]
MRQSRCTSGEVVVRAGGHPGLEVVKVEHGGFGAESGEDFSFVLRVGAVAGGEFDADVGGLGSWAA